MHAQKEKIKIKVVVPDVELYFPISYLRAITIIEKAMRLCHKSEYLAEKNSFQEREQFIKKIMNMGHLSPLEHVSVSAIFKIDRGLTHELVRHRIAAYSQTSTRYINYDKKGFTFVKPIGIPYGSKEYFMWESHCTGAAKLYSSFLKMGYKPQIARAILPICTYAEIMATFNIRQWRHVFQMRLDRAAHPAMRQVMGIAFNLLRNKYPVFFDDLSNLIN